MGKIGNFAYGHKGHPCDILITGDVLLFWSFLKHKGIMRGCAYFFIISAYYLMTPMTILSDDNLSFLSSYKVLKNRIIMGFLRA